MEAEHVASTRACFEKSRFKGGQLGKLRELVPEITTANPLSPVETRILPDLRRMKFYPIVTVNGVVRLNYVAEEYEYSDVQKSWESTLGGLYHRYQDKVYTRELWHDRERYTIFTTKPARLRCTIQAVLEPLKVRVISKGEAVPYYLSKPLQKALHSTMREMDCFRLIGRPLCPTDLFDLAAHRVQGGEGPEEWFSIDYSAATDKLSARLSSSILTYLLEGQDPALVSMWKAVLAPHKCQYPFPYNEVVKPVVQRNGQLMGSILSFPILCLANLGLYLSAISDDSRSLREKLSGVLVNGDDMLYVARRSRWETHVSLGAKVGLSMSPGKAYHHPVYANANSACFHYDLQNPRSTPYSIPFLNTGLYFGQSKVLGGDDVERAEGLCSTIPKLLAGSLPGKQCEVLSGFLKRHHVEIQEECKGRNLFISESLGGMGVSLPLGWKTEVTMAQRHVATQKWKEQSFLHWGDGPALGPPLPESPQPLTAPWLAGIRFEDDPELGMIAVGKEKKERRLDISPGARRALVNKTSISGMLGNDKLFLSTHLCSARLTKGRPDNQAKPARGPQFERTAARDWLFRNADEAWSESDRLSVSIKENPWVGISKSLEMTLDWAEFEDGLFTTAAQCLMD